MCKTNSVFSDSVDSCRLRTTTRGHAFSKTGELNTSTQEIFATSTQLGAPQSGSEWHLQQGDITPSMHAHCPPQTVVTGNK